ncbi:hypothetical protein AOLI_G00112430 [Acnodon oligacanthus]
MRKKGLSQYVDGRISVYQQVLNALIGSPFAQHCINRKVQVQINITVTLLKEGASGNRILEETRTF